MSGPRVLTDDELRREPPRRPSPPASITAIRMLVEGIRELCAAHGQTNPIAPMSPAFESLRQTCEIILELTDEDLQRARQRELLSSAGIELPREDA